MPKLGDIGNVWNTIRELNVSEIRQEAEAPLLIAVVGEPTMRGTLTRALRGRPGRFPAAGGDALIEADLPLSRDRQPELRSAALIVIAIQGNLPANPDLQRTVDQLALVAAPTVVVCLGSDRLPRTAAGRSLDLGSLPVVYVPQPSADNLPQTLMPRIVEHLPEHQRVAAARRLPGLRDAVARELIGSTSFSNATYALTSGIPEIIPLLNLPLNAADLLVLTKNQALLVYRIGLAFGAGGDFQTQMREILPVVGGSFLWRQVARQLVGLIPGFGLLPKVAVAYAGTYATGQAAALWYGAGEVLSKGALGRLYKQALAIGRQRAKELLSLRRRNGKANGQPESSTDHDLRSLPGPEAPASPTEPSAPPPK